MVLSFPPSYRLAILQTTWPNGVLNEGGKRDIVEPDLLLLLAASDRRRQNRYWTGADLVVEVVSPDKPERDLVSKRQDYAAAGVAEYWVVNPSNETILILALNKKRYRRLGSFARGSVARSSLLQEFQIGVDQVFDTD
jgi:Uma2 family endonuclease